MRSTPGFLACGVQVLGRGREEGDGRGLVGCRRGGEIDDGVDPDERVGEPLAGDDVDAVRPGDPHGLVAPLLQHVDDVVTQAAAGAGHCDPLLLHGFAPSCHNCSFSLVNWVTRQRRGM